MSDKYYNFVCNLICPVERRFTVEQAMQHPIFENRKNINFDDLDMLYPVEMPHAEMMGNIELLGVHGLKGEDVAKRCVFVFLV